MSDEATMVEEIAEEVVETRSLLAGRRQVRQA